MPNSVDPFNLDAMSLAKNYNEFLLSLVASEARGVNRIVDFGAGSGTFSGALRERGFEVSCIEPDPELQTRLRGLGLEAHPSLDTLTDESVRFIYTLNVLEHIADDAAACGLCYRKLAPGGRLLVYVPAFEVLFSSMDTKVGHLRRYRRKGLVAMLQGAGFRIERAEYVDSLGFFVTLLFKALGNRKGDLNPAGVRLFDTYIFPVSRWLDYLFHRVAGKNLLVVAAKGV